MMLPSLAISDADRERLISVARAALRSDRPPSAASMLLSEIGRARIVAKESLPKEVVAVHSTVEIQDNINNSFKRLRLVYPEDVAGDPMEVSVLTPLGAALIGLSEGDSISWCTATGDLRSVTVLRVF